MRGDFSRIRFNRRKGYTAVLEQQGRVALDADANEQCFIDENYSRATTVDAVGEYGGPAQDPGFAITLVNGHEILIGPGRYYVDGLLCENQSTLSYDSQPYLIDPADNAGRILTQLAQAGGAQVLQVYLEVWQRLVTALDDPCLREPALGQADTTARLQTVWRVVAEPAQSSGQQAAPGSVMSPCCQAMYSTAPQLSTGTLTAQTSGPSAECSCEPVAAAGYQGIENQLYRVEIHTRGDETSATFKWSRENASVVSAVTSMSVPDSTVWLDSLGPDANLGFQPEQWIELADDTYLFGAQPNLPGTLYQIKSVSPEDNSLILYPEPPLTSVDLSRNPRARRWDQTGTSATPTGISLSAGQWLELENGIQVQFSDGSYQSGDYWTLPARTASGPIDWPPCDSDGNAFQPPCSTQVHRAPLACIHWSSRSGGVFTVDNCRQLFSPLTVLTAQVPAQAIHVDSITWVNDDVMMLSQLEKDGLAITLDQAPSSPVTGANLIITAEPAVFAGNGPSTISPVDGNISVAGQTINWTLNSASLPFALQLQPFRVRIKLLGQMIFETVPDGLLYLDGQAFGRPATRKDGVIARIDLQLPSDTGAASSDFDSWFYLRTYLLSWQQVGDTSAFGSLNDGRPFWTGNFSTAGQAQLMFYSPSDQNWWLGTVTGEQLQWHQAGNTTNQPFDASGDTAFIGDFTGSGRTQIMLYDADQNWYLGPVDNNGNLPADWEYVAYSANDFLEADMTWTGDFSGVGHTQIMLYDASGGTGGSNYWWLVDGNGYGSLQGQVPTDPTTARSWTGDFTGAGRTQLLVYSPDDFNWWLGKADGSGNLTWENIDNTGGFGDLNDGQHPVWIGDFTGAGHSQVLFYYAGDSNWWLRDFTAANWTLVGNTAGFGYLNDGRPFWTGDFSGAGRTQVMFFSPGDSNWWLGSIEGSANRAQLSWQLAGNTTGFSETANAVFFTGDFTGTAPTQVLLYSPSNSLWWLCGTGMGI